MKSGRLNVLEQPPGPVQACNGILKCVIPVVCINQINGLVVKNTTMYVLKKKKEFIFLKYQKNNMFQPFMAIIRFVKTLKIVTT